MKQILFGLIFLFLTGCGVYTFSGHGIAGISSIAVEPFENRSPEFGIREQLTEALINRLLSDRTLTLASIGAADAVLKGVIVSVNDRPLTYSADEIVTENEISITVQVTLEQNKAVDPIWKSRLTGVGSYPYVTGSQEERNEGIQLALERLVDDLIAQLTSDW